jgi:hypothetical protein
MAMIWVSFLTGPVWGWSGSIAASSRRRSWIRVRGVSAEAFGHCSSLQSSVIFKQSGSPKAVRYAAPASAGAGAVGNETIERKLTAGEQIESTRVDIAGLEFGSDAKFEPRA